MGGEVETGGAGVVWVVLAGGAALDSTPNCEVASRRACLVRSSRAVDPRETPREEPEALGLKPGLGSTGRVGMGAEILGAGDGLAGDTARCFSAGSVLSPRSTRSKPPTPGPITPVVAQATTAAAQIPAARPTGALAPTAVSPPPDESRRMTTSRPRSTVAVANDRTESAAATIGSVNLEKVPTPAVRLSQAARPISISGTVTPKRFRSALSAESLRRLKVGSLQPSASALSRVVFSSK